MSDDGIQIEVTGVSGTLQRINAFSLQLGDVIVKSALKSGAKRLTSALKKAAPIAKKGTKQFPAGRLKKAIFMKTSKINTRAKNGAIGFYVMPKMKSGPGKRYGNQANAYYARMVENGYEVRGLNTGKRLNRRGVSGLKLRSGRKTQASGKHVPGKFFIRDTVNANAAAIEATITQEINAGADQLARRLGL